MTQPTWVGMQSLVMGQESWPALGYLASLKTLMFEQFETMTFKDKARDPDSRDISLGWPSESMGS